MPPFIMDQAEAQRLVDQRPWWYHRFEIFPGVVTPGVYDASHLLRALRFPDDMTGMSVLEIGPADGYFTKMLDMRGANVVAMNICAKDVHGFSVTEKLHGKSLRYVHSNLYDIGKHGFEPFDYVLCSGVLYHLPDMLRGSLAATFLRQGRTFVGDAGHAQDRGSAFCRISASDKL